MLFGALILWGGLVAAPSNPIACGPIALGWQSAGDVWLPSDGSLDLGTGEILAEGATRTGLVQRRDLLDGAAPLMLLAGDETGQPLGMIRRESSKKRGKRMFTGGAEYFFEGKDDSWGYVRVLGVWEDGISLELARAGPGVTKLVRDPSRVVARLDENKIQLTWDATEGASYLIEGRAAGRDQEFTSLDEVQGGSWTGSIGGPGLMEYRVTGLGGGGLGARVRVVRQVRSLDMPGVLPAGARWNLLTGAIDGETHHVEVTQNQGQNLIFALAEGMRVGTAAKQISKRSGPAPPVSSSWRPAVPWLQDVVQANRQHVLPTGASICLLTPEGIPVRIYSRAGPDGSLLFWRQMDLSGTGLFPSAPKGPTVESKGHLVGVQFESLSAKVPAGDRVRLVLEEVDSEGHWAPLMVGAAGERTLEFTREVGGDALPIARLRARQEYEGGPRSAASEPFSVLLVDREDSSELERLVQRGLDALLDEAYGQRLQARTLLLALGADALPALEAALVASASGTEVHSSVRDLLLSGGFGAGGQRLVLLSAAMEEGLEGDIPRGLDASHALDRALAVLGLAGRSRSVDWLRLAAQAESDPAVLTLIDLMLDDPEPPLVLDQPSDALVLLPPDRRPLREPQNWVQELQLGAPQELASFIRGTVDAGRGDRAMALLSVAHFLEQAENPPDAGTLESAELALRMLERVRPALEPEFQSNRISSQALLDIVGTLLDGEGYLMRAQRELAALQLDSWPLPDGVREQIVVPPDDEGALRGILIELSRKKSAYVDILIPEGRHLLSEGVSSQAMGVSGMRLKGVEGTVLVGTLRVDGCRDVVLEDLTIEGERTSALWALDTELLMRRVVLSGTQRAVQATGASLVMDQCRVGDLDLISNSQLVWLAQGSVLDARNSSFLGGNIYLDEGGEARFDRCVLDSGARPTIQGRSASSRATLRDCMVRSRAGCMSGAGTIWLERCVLDLAADPIYQAVNCVACPDSVVLVGATSGFGPHVQQRCCLGR